MKITFKNNKGKRMKLDSKLTLKDLVRMGFTNFRLMKPENPLPDGWWRDTGGKEKTK